MKTRNGFVSNSSSSSFVVFGDMTRLGFYDFTKEDCEHGIIYCHGKELGEGCDFFQVTKEIYNFLGNRDNVGDDRIVDMSFVKVYHISSSLENITKKDIDDIVKNIPETTPFRIITIDSSNHSSSSKKDVRDRYFDGVVLEDEEDAAIQYVALEERKKEQEKALKEIEKKLKDMQRSVNQKIVNKIKGEK